MRDGYESTFLRWKKKCDANMHSITHLIFMIKLEFEDRKTKEKRCSKICFPDLASPDRHLQTYPNNTRLSSFVNSSLNALARVIQALKHRVSPIPYKEHKLTHFLKDILT